MRRRDWKPAWIGLALALSCFGSNAEPSPEGVWKTIDDHSGQPRGTVVMYQKNGAWFGKIASVFSQKEARERCIRCTGDRKNAPVLGLVVVRDMRQKGEEYQGGDILDPETGGVYRCKFRLTEGGNKLLIRGYLGFSLLGRTQTWIRETPR